MFLLLFVFLPMLAAFIVAAWQALLFVLSPGFFYARHTIKVEPAIGPYEDELVPLHAKQSIESDVQLLKREGFEQQAALCLQSASDAWTYLVVMRHPDTRDRAMLKAILHEDPSLRLKESHIELRAELADGRCVRTLNSAALTPFGAEPHAIETFTDQHMGPRALLNSHRLFCGQQSATVREENPPEDAIALLLRLASEERERWKARDLVVLDERCNVLRLTYKGACLMSWGRLWPVSATRRSLVASDALRKLGGATTTCNYDRRVAADPDSALQAALQAVCSRHELRP